jgi:ADP-ribose pyrophosphatase YjhB (NUDIX family)
MTAIRKIDGFNIRVYALIINSAHEVLLSDEERFGLRMTKFPGGGLVPGEGILDCLHREAMEEFGQPVRIERHFYTTDFFQRAWFHENQQLISVYYLARFTSKEKFRIESIPFNFQSQTGEVLAFRYKSIAGLEPEELTFPVDKYVAGLLKKSWFDR